MENLLSTLLGEVITIKFLWIVVAVTATMEYAKKFLPYWLQASKWYPVITAVITAGYLAAKTAITGDWKEWIANFVFTIVIVDLFYTWAGKHIIAGLVWVFQKKTWKPEENGTGNNKF